VLHVCLLAQHLSFEIVFGFVQVFLEVKGCFDLNFGIFMRIVLQDGEAWKI